jgi:hypothetical protein
LVAVREARSQRLEDPIKPDFEVAKPPVALIAYDRSNIVNFILTVDAALDHRWRQQFQNLLDVISRHEWFSHVVVKRNLEIIESLEFTYLHGL